MSPPPTLPRRAVPALLAAPLLAACGGATADAPRPTRTPAPPTPTPRPDYAALRQRLLVPLQALIVAARDGSPTLPARRAEFDAAAEGVLPAIAGDVSEPANRLHSVIVNAKEAAAARDVPRLERQRLELLEVR